MQLKSNKGFTVVEVAVTVGLVGAIAVSALGGYMLYIPKAQSLEPVRMMETQKLILSKNIEKGFCGKSDGSAADIKGRFGTLTISGTVINTQGATCPTGCKMTYTFDNNAAIAVKGKKLDVKVLKDMKLSKTADTTLNERYLPVEFGQAISSATDNCAALSSTNPSVTGGDDTGTDTGVTDPSNPGVPDPSNPGSGGNGGTDPADPPGETVTEGNVKPDGGICTDSFTVTKDSTVVKIGSNGYYKAESEYFIRDGVNLRSLFVDVVGRQPKPNEVVDFYTTCAVGIVSHQHHVPAITVGNWDSSAKLTLHNFGVLLGRGGNASDAEIGMVSAYPKVLQLIPGFYNTATGAITAFPEKGYQARVPTSIWSAGFAKSKFPVLPGHAIVNNGSATLIVKNSGIIAGGGGAGDEVATFENEGDRRSGGGAPYGLGGKAYQKSGNPYNDGAHSINNGQDASFTAGGYPGRYRDRSGGWGAGWGQDGNRSAGNNPTYAYSEYHHQLAGFYKIGDVVITNEGEGRVMGRSD